MLKLVHLLLLLLVNKPHLPKKPKNRNKAKEINSLNLIKQTKVEKLAKMLKKNNLKKNNLKKKNHHHHHQLMKMTATTISTYLVDPYLKIKFDFIPIPIPFHPILFLPLTHLPSYIFLLNPITISLLLFKSRPQKNKITKISQI